MREIYLEGATKDFDFGIDSKLFSFSGSTLYSLIDDDNENYVIQGRVLPFDDNDMILLGFRANQPGSFTISLVDFDGVFAEGQNIYLRDNVTQIEHSLNEGSYEFVSDQGVFHTRFEIIYKPSGTLNIENSNLNTKWIIYKQNNTLQIQTQDFEMKEVMVYDILGRIVHTSEVEGKSHTLPYLGADQMLIVKITTTDNKVLSKKVRN